MPPISSALAVLRYHPSQLPQSDQDAMRRNRVQFEWYSRSTSELREPEANDALLQSLLSVFAMHNHRVARKQGPRPELQPAVTVVQLATDVNILQHRAKGESCDLV